MDYSTDINKGFRLISFYCIIEKYINLLDCSTILEILMTHYLISNHVTLKKKPLNNFIKPQLNTRHFNFVYSL